MSIRKTALEALKTKFDGIDEKVLSRMAAKIAKTAETEDEAKEEVEGLTLQGIIDSYVDSRVAEGTNTAIENYEKKHGLKDGKKVGAANGDGDGNNGNDPEPKKKDGDGDDMPSWAKKLMEDIGALKAGKQADKRKSALDKLLKDVPEDKRKSFVREFSRATFKDDEDFDAWIEEITPDVEAIASDHKANGSTTGSPKGGGGNNSPQVNAIVQQRADARKAETEAPAIKGLPT